ncbi:prolipoprotein diacylglyceryl transferase [Candidatus Uhrbacteria bacterium]|nr:prolipoprotein diacylglyceryl transferase [Candidatus Uhrbacteria bacterium]
MIPYFGLTTVPLGPITLSVWGAMAAAGFLIGTIVAARRARAVGLDPKIVWDAAGMIVLSSIIGSRLFEIFFYRPDYFWEHPWDIVRIWDGGMSSTGGIIGAGLFVYWFIRRHRLPALEWLDVFAFAAPLGLMFGRIGCYFINDHPGKFTSLFLGVNYPDGIRHDGGLEMALADGAIFALFLFLSRKKLSAGAVALLFIALKGLARFALDFNRAADIALPEARYFGLTPSQYIGMIALVILAVVAVQWRIARGTTRVKN